MPLGGEGQLVLAGEIIAECSLRLLRCRAFSFSCYLLAPAEYIIDCNPFNSIVLQAEIIRKSNHLVFDIQEDMRLS